MKLELVDKYGDRTEAWIHYPSYPELVDEHGRSLLCMDGHPYFPQRWRRKDPSESPAQRVLNAFLMRPSQGLDVSWLDDPEGEEGFLGFLEGILVLTGKCVVSASK